MRLAVACFMLLETLLQTAGMIKVISHGFSKRSVWPSAVPDMVKATLSHRDEEKTLASHLLPSWALGCFWGLIWAGSFILCRGSSW